MFDWKYVCSSFSRWWMHFNNFQFIVMFHIIFNFNSQLYDRLKIHREQESSDTYWIIWTHITLMMNAILWYAIKCKSNLFNEMHINAMMNKRYWCYNNALPKCDNDDDFLLLLCILWFFFLFCGHSILFQSILCQIISARSAKEIWDSFRIWSTWYFVEILLKLFELFNSNGR